MRSADELTLLAELTGPALRGAIAAMDLPGGSRGIDAGCGSGVHLAWLAGAAGPGSTVHGVDLSAANLEAARELVAGSGVADRIVLERHNLLELDFPDGSFDWAWSADTLFPVGAMEPVAALAELARVVRPGGRIGLAFWSGQQLLPGQPELEARLHEAQTRQNPSLAGVPPELHFLRARRWMGEVGLEAVRARGFVADVEGPLAGRRREALALCLEMLWGELQPTISPADWRETRWLRDPTSPQFVGDEADYYGFITYTLFTGKRPEGARA